MTPSTWIDSFAHADSPPPSRLAPFVRWALRGSWGALSLGACISILSGVVEVASALILGAVIDAALNAPPERVFSDGAGILIASLVFFLLLRPIFFGSNALMQNIVVAPNLFNMILQRLHRHTLGQAVTFFDNDFAGRISQKEIQTARALTDAVVEMLQTVFFALATIIAAVLMLGGVDWRIAIALAGWVFCYIWMIRFFMPRIRSLSKARAGTRAALTGQIVDTITNIKTVKLFAHADHEDQAALGAMGRHREANLNYGRVAVTFRFCLMAFAGILPVVLVGGALWYWSLGLVTAGDIAATGSVAIRLAHMTGWVSFTLMTLYANIGEVEDGIRTLSPGHTLTDVDGAVALEVPRGQIVLHDLGFAYGRETGGVQNINLTINPGEKLGIVGASGAGKSTLVSLLLRLYDPETGRIEIDGQDIGTASQESLRRQIGMVTQETAMFNRSARDNIMYGNPDATDAQVIAAAQKAEAHEFIGELEDFKGRKGYDAHLGERGVKLSGGQRQRIALARAILKDAPILVLDEATSALDSEVEAAIQTALSRVMEGKTVLAIAHRLSTLTEMDRIVVLDAGRVVEEGSHESLLAQSGLYAQYWQRQSGGFIQTEAAE